MKTLFSLVVLAVLLGTGWYVYQNNMVAVPTNSESALQDSGSMGDMMDSAMPAMEGSTVEEKEVMTDSGKTGMMDGEMGMMGDGEVFNITGKMFAFSQTEMRVKKGTTVTVNFESTEGLHDWVVDEFNARTKQVQPGTKTSVTFVADKAGTFEYYCAVGKHRQQGMVGKLIVE